MMNKDLHDKQSRLGISVSKRVGNAVQRNWIKRNIRETFRRNDANVVERHDLIIMVKRPVSKQESKNMRGMLKEIFLTSRKKGH